VDRVDVLEAETEVLVSAATMAESLIRVGVAGEF
jgi:hypothetical protein